MVLCAIKVNRLRHEIFLFSLQFSATFWSTLPEMGKFFTKIRHIRQTCPKWANALRQLLGNQIDRGTAIDFHVSHTVSPVATGAIRWAKPTQTMHQATPNWNMKTINEWSFVNLHNVKALTGKPKSHSNHKVGWFSPQTHTNQGRN